MVRYEKTIGDRIFDLVIALFVIFVIVITLYPLIYIVSMSISDPVAAARGQVYLLPKGINLSAIKKVLSDASIWRYYYNTIWYTFVGTLMGVAMTTIAAYPLSRKNFKGRGIFMRFILVTMFFGGGLIPTYIVVAKFLRLYNTRWAIVLPGLTSAWYIIITRTYFESLPEQIIECARLDGASEFRVFLKLVLPLAKPILGVLILYYAVGYWNSYFSAMIYLSDKSLQPLALYIKSVVIQNSMEGLAGTAGTQGISASALLSSLQIKYAVIVISVLPMLLFYPLISKNLEKGIMIGAIKG